MRSRNSPFHFFKKQRTIAFDVKRMNSLNPRFSQAGKTAIPQTQKCHPTLKNLLFYITPFFHEFVFFFFLLIHCTYELFIYFLIFCCRLAHKYNKILHLLKKRIFSKTNSLRLIFCGLINWLIGGVYLSLKDGI